MVPAKRESRPCLDGSLCEGVLPIEGIVEVVPGIWPSSEMTGMVLVTSLDEDALLQPGDPIAEIRTGLVETSLCECGLLDTSLIVPIEGENCELCGAARLQAFDPCVECGSKERTAVRDLQGCTACQRSLGGRGRKSGYGLLAALVAVSVLGKGMSAGGSVSPVGAHRVEDPAVNTFLGSLPGPGWWDCQDGHCLIVDVGDQGFEMPSVPAALRFLSLVFHDQDDGWMLWGTLDRHRHQIIPSEWGELVHCRVGAFFTRYGPEWSGWLPGSTTCGLGMSRGRSVDRVDTVMNPCLHIMESVDFEKMGEETPTDYYYDRLREDLGRRHPKADSFLLDHLVSLEGFLDKSIVFGFSFGVAKAEICVENGKLLGHIIGRSGTQPDLERCQAVVDFPPLKEKTHIQQFLGCGNWLRGYLPAEFGHVAKILGAYQKPGAEFPEGGIGSGDTEACKAFKAIKKMICEHIALAIFDEASAADGSCPLEQIADASGIAVGGTVLQMTRDMSKMKILLTHSRSLTPAQQRWPPLIQEAYAQLEVKRATRKAFGTIRTLCWTDHANLTRAQSSDIGVDVKLVRWVSEILSDGSELRSLSGRSAKLGDGFSRNPKDRDALLEARTKDLSSLQGQMRGFDLDDFLGDGVEEGEQVVAWAIGNDAVPDKTGTLSDWIGVAVPSVARALLVMDYARDVTRVMVETRAMLSRAMPGISLEVRASFGPFEDDEGIASQFDGAVGRLVGPKRIKRIRLDLLTSCAKVLRDVASFLPDFVIGFGQGGVISSMIRWPLVVELTLQARNLQNREVRQVGSAWSKIKGVWSVNPRVWKTQIGAEDVMQACPEIRKEFSVEPLKGFGVSTKQGRPDDTAAMFETLRLSKVEGIDALNLRSLLLEPSREMWEHSGVCSCGKRTYLFSRCPACIEKEAHEVLEAVLEGEHDREKGSDELDLEEGLDIDVLAMSSSTQGRGVRFIATKVLESWGRAGRQVQSHSQAETKYGELSVCKWKGLDQKMILGRKSSSLPYVTSWVLDSEGVILCAHHCCREEVSTPSRFQWGLDAVNWHNHRSLVTEVCNIVWKTGLVRDFGSRFRSLLHLIGIPDRVQTWDDGDGEKALGCRKSLRERKVIVCFQENEEGHWDEIQLSRKIKIKEGRVARTLAVVGHEDRGPRVALTLRSSEWILTRWPEEPRGVPVGVIAEIELYDRDSLAKEARDAAGVSEFKVSGSLRGAWHEAQRKDESLASYFRKTAHPYRLAGDGVLEREVQLKTGQTLYVPVVPNGVVADNGLTWRKSCYFAVHGGVLGAHRSAQVTFKLLERSVWWPSMEEDIKRWVEGCLSCLKGRSRPTKVEAKAVKCGATSCWEEVSVDCEGSNKEDRDGYRYSLTYLCCLCHGVLLEPMRSLTHTDVRKAFTKCILRSRTIPSLVRSDRGVEFKNTLMKELNAILGVQQRFSMALRPCEMGTNERMHQEVQKALGSLVRELGVAENWSDWLVVAEYVLDNTPGPHGYTPRDLERSWSLALPLEKDVLHEALQFEPISDWARRQFSQFKEISQIVIKHWDRASEARTKLANRFRRHVDFKVGDRVVWKSPKGRPEGAARLPWKPDLHGPWVIVDIRGNRLWLEAVAPPLAGAAADPSSSSSSRKHEAHAEDCILVPADSGPESRAPVVFEASGDEGPSLGQQASGEAKQVEFTVKRRGRDFVLRIGDKIAYRKTHSPKVAYLGRVTQVDIAQASISVHKYSPDTSGLRVKWRLEFLNEEGSVGPDGTRPLLEPVSIKEVICKVDLMKDGVLAASSARKLDKGGYSLKEQVRVETRLIGPGEYKTGLHLAEELLSMLEKVLAADNPSKWPSVWQSAEGRVVWSWLEAHPPARIDFWELFAGQAGLTLAAKERNLSVAPPLDCLYPAFGRIWNLASSLDQELFWCLYDVLRPLAIHAGLPCEHYSVMGERKPDQEDQSIRVLVCRVLKRQDKEKKKGTAESPTSSLLWQEPDWVQEFGQLSSPIFPWQYMSTDGCQYGMESKSLSDDTYGQPIKKAQVWLGNFCMSEFSLRCGRPDALALLEHSHRHVKGTIKVEVAEGKTKWMGVGKLSGVYEPACCHAYMTCLKRALQQAEGRTVSGGVPPRERIVPRSNVYTSGPPGTADPKGVVTSDSLSPAEREKLDKEVEEMSRKMDTHWKTLADQADWDQVKADLSIYKYSGQNVTEDPRRVDAYRQEVLKGLGFGEDWKEKRPYLTEHDIEACREVLQRKAGGFWLEGSPRTTVRNVLHDCVPSGPPVSSQPHNLKGEAADWVDEKLEEEVRRGQLVRGSSAWGSPPFPTKEAPAHKRHRKRRLVVDYRRVNARVVRSTYYCRKASDVLASAAGSVWYSFVDAVTGFNQIRNSRRAMEILAIVARSGKFLPVCLTFGPINGPDDFSFVVDRAFAPGRGRKMKYTKEWVAYVDDLTVRTGRVVDGRFLTDDQAADEIKTACRKSPVEAVQPAEDALKALGVGLEGTPSMNRQGVSSSSKHDEKESDHNHPTRRNRNACFGAGSFRVLVMLLQTAVVLDLWTWFDLGFSPQLFVGSCPRWLKISAGRSATCVFRVRVDPEIRSPAGGMPRRNQEKLNYWESPKELQYCMTKAYRHGAYSHRGRLSRGGWIKMSESADLFQITVGQLWDALALEENSGQKKRFEVSRGWIRAAQGHSSDSGLQRPSDVYLEVTEHSLAERGFAMVSPLYHGTDADRVESIINFGLLAGGGNERNRLAVHWILARPVRIAEVPGFRSGSTALIETSIRRLIESGVGVYHGSEGVILTESVPPEGLLRAWLYNDGQYSNLVADFDVDENAIKLLPDPEAPQANDDDVGVLDVLPDGDTDATTEEDDEEEEKVEASGSKAAESVKSKASEPASSSGIKRDAAGRALEEAPAVVRDAEPEASSRVVSMEEGPAAESGADPRDEGVAIAEGTQEVPKQEAPAVVTDAVGSGEAAKVLGSGVKRTIQKKKTTQAARAKAKSGSYRISPKAKAKAKAKAMAVSEEDRGYKVTGRALKLSPTVIQLAEAYAARVACSKRQLESPFFTRNLAVRRS